MSKQEVIKHSVERGIMAYLTTHQYARFSDIRPKDVDTNLFTYHLKLLVKAGYVTKDGTNYTLSPKGCVYVDRLADTATIRTQPEVITMLLVQDGYGNIVVQKRAEQPYINTWTLPYATVLIDDESILAAGARVATETLGFAPAQLRHAGDCYIVVGRKATVAAESIAAGTLIDGDVLHLNTKEIFQIQARTLVHVVRFETDDLVVSGDIRWINPLDITKMGAAPGVEQIIARAFFGDDFFFEEFRIEQ